MDPVVRFRGFSERFGEIFLKKNHKNLRHNDKNTTCDNCNKRIFMKLWHKLPFGP